MSLQAELNKLRDAIDGIDDTLLQLLGQRAELAKQVGHLKSSGGHSFHVPERERHIIERLRVTCATTSFPADSIGPVFREIMSACLRLESPITVAYLGPGTSFSYLALRRAFGESAVAAAQKTIDGVFDAIESDRADYAVVPLENSFEGTVNSSMQRMIKTRMWVHGEIYLPICHNLGSLQADLKKITKVFSHPQALNQCRNWLQEYLPHADLIETLSTAQACVEVGNKPDSAAISSVQAALENGLQVVVRNIQDKQDNQTRFLILSQEKKLSERPNDKTSIIFSVPDTHGGLAKVFNIFAKNGVNLTKLESMPSRESTWGVYFWMDLCGNQSFANVSNAIAEAKACCDTLKVVGSYPLLS